MKQGFSDSHINAYGDGDSYGDGMGGGIGVGLGHYLFSYRYDEDYALYERPWPRENRGDGWFGYSDRRTNGRGLGDGSGVFTLFGASIKL